MPITISWAKHGKTQHVNSLPTYLYSHSPALSSKRSSNVTTLALFTVFPLATYTFRVCPYTTSAAKRLASFCETNEWVAPLSIKHLAGKKVDGLATEEHWAFTVKQPFTSDNTHTSPSDIIFLPSSQVSYPASKVVLLAKTSETGNLQGCAVDVHGCDTCRELDSRAQAGYDLHAEPSADRPKLSFPAEFWA